MMMMTKMLRMMMAGPKERKLKDQRQTVALAFLLAQVGTSLRSIRASRIAPREDERRRRPRPN